VSFTFAVASFNTTSTPYCDYASTCIPVDAKELKKAESRRITYSWWDPFVGHNNLKKRFDLLVGLG
jgi:hypothetical protein